MKLDPRCQHPKCNNKLGKANKSRFCNKHSDFSTLRRYSSLKKNSKIRDLPVNLSFKNYLDIIKKGCYYCSKDIMIMTGTGLDRINNKLGYSKKNAIACCANCNMFRGTFFTMDEFKNIIKYIQVHIKKKQNIWEEFTSHLTKNRRKRHGI
jgi:hypothetical protein